MKTIKQVQLERSDLFIQIAQLEKSKEKKDISLCKRLEAKSILFNTYILLLETNPTEAYLQSEVDRICERINAIMVQYKPLDEKKHTKSAITANKKAFEKLWEVPKLRKQLTHLYYILK